MSQPQPTAPIHVCAVDDLCAGLGHTVEIQGRCIALFRTVQGKVFATDNACPHQEGPLAEGMLDGESIVCPLHAYSFDFATGKCDEPGTDPVKTYPIEIRDNQVYIHLPG